jgi:hypothetical protein
MKTYLLIINLAMIFLTACQQSGQIITTGTLLEEMTNLERLCQFPEQPYRTLQYSSYDRRSTKPGDPSWFANDDGFGNEPIPGFECVLKHPDISGIGTYLICDIQQPGAILRLWTAGIKGKIRFFLDDMDTPVYDSVAEGFFWKTMEVLSGNEVKMDALQAFRQSDAVYFPIPFSKRCRIEWTGDIKEIHFYHVGVRIYDPGVDVETFSAEDFKRFMTELEETNRNLLSQNEKRAGQKSKNQLVKVVVPASSTIELFSTCKAQAINRIMLNITALDYEEILRKCVLRIYFDSPATPQVQAPIGDFFGAAPGINPYRSIPFAVQADSTMVCRFLMPFKHSARLVIDNQSEEDIGIRGEIGTTDHRWEHGKSMHFYGLWRIDYDLTASNINDRNNVIRDMLYLNASGRGRMVGAAAFIYNPSNVPTSWGNWWGEGDEKIFIDRDTFPSFFGTGSEDYFNYSWSSSRIFSYPYSGQPRNDGPGNRGYVSNFRWHILDDMLFEDKAIFTMELRHHGIVPGVSYGRIVYLYAMPGLISDPQETPMANIRKIDYQTWEPEAYLGSSGFTFIQAEKLVNHETNVEVEPGKMWAAGSILMWKPEGNGEEISFPIHLGQTIDRTSVGFTLAHGPSGGKISVLINGKPIKVDGNQTVDLLEPNHRTLVNHFSEPVRIIQGTNEITFISVSAEKDQQIGIDFLWINDQAILLRNAASE